MDTTLFELNALFLKLAILEALSFKLLEDKRDSLTSPPLARDADLLLPKSSRRTLAEL
jgi:hypothetical protein